MPRKRTSQNAKSGHVFGQARKVAKNVAGKGCMSHVSTNDKETLAMQNPGRCGSPRPLAANCHVQTSTAAAHLQLGPPALEMPRLHRRSGSPIIGNSDILAGKVHPNP